MSKFIGIKGGAGGDHGGLTGLTDDDHPQYLITTAIRSTGSPTSGIIKTDLTTGDVFTLVNAGSGAALFIQQTGDTSGADAAVDIDNTGNSGRGLSVVSDNSAPYAPLVQFSALNSSFDEPVLLITHNEPCGLALEIQGDAYISCQLEVGEGVSVGISSSNPFSLGDAGFYIKESPEGNGEFYFVNELGEERTFTKAFGLGGAAGDGYYPFIEVDQLTVAGASPGTLDNTSGAATSGALIRNDYNDFQLGPGTIEIKGLTLRSSVDGVLVPEIVFDIIKGATLVDDTLARTSLSGGTLVASNIATVESETFESGRKDGEIQFTTGAIDLTLPAFNDGYADGDYFFIFKADHTLDTKTILIKRATQGPEILSITFTYPTCTFTGMPQTAVRNPQTFTVVVNTSTAPGDSLATAVQIDAGDAAQSTVALSEGPAGTWTGVVTARAAQTNGLADLNATATDSLANVSSASTTDTGDPLVVFDNDFPTIESYEESLDIVYPVGQSCLKFGESADAYMSVSDFTEILYSSPTSRFTINDPTNYDLQKTITWDQGSSGVEENPDITGGLPTTNLTIRARKASNCSELTRNMQIRLDDTPPRVSSIRWRRNDTGSYALTSPTLAAGTHGVRFIFDDPLTVLPVFSVLDGYKGSLGAISGTIPGDTFTATFTITDGYDIDGCSELVLDSAVNCSNKQPLAADPIDGSDEDFCIDTSEPEIVRVEIDVDLTDGYFNDGYDGYNQLNDDINNTDNTEQACLVDFSSGVQSITAADVLTRHDESVVVTVEMANPIPLPGAFNAETCVFDASPWGASASTPVSRLDNFLFQDTFITALGSTRTDDQAANIGRASIWHATGNDATVTDTALNSDVATNVDVLSANGVDDIGDYISFTENGTATPSFKVATSAFRAFMIGRKVKIVDDDTAATIRTVVASAVDGTITVDGGSLVAYTTAQNARAVPLSATRAEVAAWDTSNGLVAYVNDGAFTQLCVCDWANPEAFSQHLTNDQLTQNNAGTVGVDLFRAAFWGSKLSVPNTNGGTEDNPTGVANSKYVWRSKKMRLTNNPTGVQGTNIRFMLFGFTAGTGYRNVNITSTSDWDNNANRYNLGNNDSQIDIRISVDEPFAAIQPLSIANWYDVTNFQVSPQAGFKFGNNKDLNIVFTAPATDVIDKDIYVEITLTTNVSGKAPQVDLFAFSFLA